VPGPERAEVAIDRKRGRLVTVAIAIAASTAVVIVVARPARAPRPNIEAPACEGFDFPVGPPDATGYYDAQPFGANDHLGNDWNGVGGGDSDRGDPVYAASAGIVAEAIDHGGGWGNVVRILHPACDRLESLYAHLETIEVAPGAHVARGQRIGTIGTAGGQYPAHLHFELRARPLPLGGGYAPTHAGYLDPTAYIRLHRARR